MKRDIHRLRDGEVNGNHESRAGLALRTLDECAEIMGISRQAAHQIERRALNKLRRALWKSKLEYYGE